MGRKRAPGLYRRHGIWHIDKYLFGKRICDSCRTDSLEEAEKYLARRTEQLREALVYGVRPKRTFREAATKYLRENTHKRSIRDDASRLRQLDSFIGHLFLTDLHMGVLQSFIQSRKQVGNKTRTINHGLEIVKRILNVAANEWQDEGGLTWLCRAPKIKFLQEYDLRLPYPLDWDEQDRLFKALPVHLRDMALYAVNTGCRDKEVCYLQWRWEITIPTLPHILVFLIPNHFVKNGHERLVVCNKIAQAIIDRRRGQHPTHVFTFRGKPIKRMNNSAWRRARESVGLNHVRVHDLKHTFGRRLRSAGVTLEDRQDLLGHKSNRITTHYSSVELKNLYRSANAVCEKRSTSVILKRALINGR